ncbi:MAG: Lrp/AsnC family transcriptional regulator [Clostridium sp.]
MDHTDIKIINILQENCKTSTREIGQMVGLTAPAVAERINRLKDTGVIEGFHAQINETLLGNHMGAFMLVNVPPKEYAPFCKFCEDNPAIVEHHHVVGLNNVLLRVRVCDAQELEVLLRQIRKYGLSNTSVLLSTFFKQKPFPVIDGSGGIVR